MTLPEMAALTLAAVVAGVINAVAGGGTLISFPAAVAVGLSPLVANATNAVALMPGSIASAFAYRRELGQDRDVVRLFLPPAAAGAVVGSILLLVTPQRIFDAIVPLLVFFATALLFAQNLRRAQQPTLDDAAWHVPQRPAVALLIQFLVGVYGGYFGAGMGIMILAILTRMGGANIHRMNGVKTVLSAAINALASVAFVVAGAINYRAAAVMAVGAIAGGFVGAGVARKVKPSIVRWGVVAIGLVLTVSLAYKRWAFPHHP